MRIQTKPFFLGMLLASFPVLTFLNVKRSTTIIEREKITPQAAMTVAVEEADFLARTRDFQQVSETQVMMMRSFQRGDTVGEIIEELPEGIEMTTTDTEEVTDTVEVQVNTTETGVPLEPLFDMYSQEYSVPKDVLKTIAHCESGSRPQAINGPYGGMYQFSRGTWVSNRKAMGLPHNPELRFQADESIKTAAFKISQDGVGAWPVCGKRAIATLGT